QVRAQAEGGEQDEGEAGHLAGEEEGRPQGQVLQGLAVEVEGRVTAEAEGELRGVGAAEGEAQAHRDSQAASRIGREEEVRGAEAAQALTRSDYCPAPLGAGRSAATVRLLRGRLSGFASDCGANDARISFERAP